MPQIDTLLACGGLTKNPLFIQEHADITGATLSLSHGYRYDYLTSLYHFICQTLIVSLVISSLLFSIGYPITLPRENEAVLLGAAILGAVASKTYSTVREAMKALNAPGRVRSYCTTTVIHIHNQGDSRIVCICWPSGRMVNV